MKNKIQIYVKLISFFSAVWLLGVTTSNAEEDISILRLSVEDRYHLLREKCKNKLQSLNRTDWAYERFSIAAENFKSFSVLVNDLDREKLLRAKTLIIKRRIKPKIYLNFDSNPGMATEKLTLKLNSLGIGARLIGVTEFNGSPATGSELIPFKLETKHLDPDDPKQKEFKIYNSALIEIYATAGILNQIGISDVDNLNFLISPDGKRATLIDLDQLLRKQTASEDPYDIADAIVRNLTRFFDVVD